MPAWISAPLKTPFSNSNPTKLNKSHFSPNAPKVFFPQNELSPLPEAFGTSSVSWLQIPRARTGTLPVSQGCSRGATTSGSVAKPHLTPHPCCFSLPASQESKDIWWKRKQAQSSGENSGRQKQGPDIFIPTEFCGSEKENFLSQTWMKSFN